jgi:U3 small nucleolar ribonucleoprotein protein IMP4
MLRRQARERRAYIHQKALAQKSNIANLRRLKAHLDKDKELPKDLQDPSLRKDLRFDEALLEEAEQLDDEYYNMGMRDPRVLITTSRDPSSRLLQFSKVQTPPFFSVLSALTRGVGNASNHSEFNAN